MDRRQALRNIAGVAGCVAGLGVTQAHAAPKGQAILKPGERLAYSRLEPAYVASIAYRQNVRSFGCMYQVFHSVIEALAQSNSPDADRFALIPTTLSRFGRGGVLGQGTVCGTNNASGMLYDLISINGRPPKSLGLLSDYYQQAMLPRKDGQFLKAVDVTEEGWLREVGVQTEARSLLCHASLTRWSEASGKPIKDKESRCQLLSASIAWRVVELLNAELSGGELPVSLAKEEVDNCLGCHTKGMNDSGAASVMVQMECSTCHGEEPHSI